MKKQRVRGLYINQITVQREVKAPDGQGGYVSSWVSGQQRRANIRQKSDSRNEQGLQIGNDFTFEIFIDSKGFDVRLNDRLLYGSKYLYIQGIENIEQRNTEYRITAIERRTL